MNTFVNIAKTCFFVHLLTLGLCQISAAETAPHHRAAPKVALDTTEGTITIELYAEKAPKTVENFLRYINEGFYDGLVFHRVIPGFMIQGGGFDVELKKKATHPPIVNEANAFLPNKRGTVAMARTSAPDSATSQFFINLVNNQTLNKNSRQAGYAVFGKVIEGMAVVDKIARVKTERKDVMADVPSNPITIKRAVQIER